MKAARSESDNCFCVDANRIKIPRLADVDGATSGVGNFSVTPRVLIYTAPLDKVATLQRFICAVTDAGNFSAAGYGALAALTNGITITIHDQDGVQNNTLTDVSIKSSIDWAALVCNVRELAFGNGDNALVFHWELGSNNLGARLRPGWSVRVRLNDNFSGLVGHTFSVQVYLLDDESDGLFG